MSKSVFSEMALGEIQVGGVFYNLNSTNVTLPDSVADAAVSRFADRGANTSTPFPPSTDEAAAKRDKPKPTKQSHN